MTAAPRRPVVSAGPRLAARARNERRSRRLRVLRRVGLGVLVLVPVGLLTWLMLSAPMLALRRVDVAGTDRLSPAQVQAAVHVAAGTPLARIDTDAVAARVAALAPVASVEVVRSWPTTLRVQVSERIPVAVVEQPGGTFRLVDGSGVPFAEAASAPPGLVRLEVPAPGPAADAPATRAALHVLRDLPAELRSQVVTVQAQTPSAVTLQLKGRRTVVWGSAEDADRKSPVVQALLPHKGRTIDVSSPGVAVLRGPA